jgi:hypothetical protein
MVSEPETARVINAEDELVARTHDLASPGAVAKVVQDPFGIGFGATKDQTPRSSSPNATVPTSE